MLIAFLTTLISIPFEIAYWIKWTLAYIRIYLYNATHHKRFDLYDATADGNPEKIGFLVPQIEADLESPQDDIHLQEKSDAVFFYGVNSKGECLVARISRGRNQDSESWLYFKLANGKSYHLAEPVSYQLPFEGKCLSFSCGNLQMECLLPMRRWRIHYCGPLIEKSSDKGTPEKQVFVKFVFIWSASSDVYDINLDTNPTGVANAMAVADWPSTFRPPIQELLEAMDSYSQMGNIRGTVSIDADSEHEMFLFGEKQRSLRKSANLAGSNFEHLYGYVPENGFGFHLMVYSCPKYFKKLTGGFIIQPSGELNNIADLDLAIKPFSSAKGRRDFQASCNAGKYYEITGSVSTEPFILYSGQGWHGFLELSLTTFSVKGKTGYGLLCSGEVYNEPVQIPETLTPTPFPESVPYAVKFTDEISQFGDISGGKGSSVGKLTQLSRTDKTFTVPKGLVVTTSAYQAFLTRDMLNAIKNVENVTYGNIKGDIKEACGKVSEIILNAPLTNKISKSITENLNQIFGNKYKEIKFAVRSSATGEDTDTMSAAGQMDTYLGVQGVQEIFTAVKKCWASQFGHIAIEYKRQNGQPLNCPMAVVIQEMVACEVSGVLFTCDPVNNNPNVITITANYGLGETVVSGSVEPDTIMLSRTTNDELKIKSVNVGSKHQRIILNEDGGTVTEDLSEDSKNSSCITMETAEILGKLAINVEKFYKSSRDIEWGILNNKIYLLQSRPVTSGGDFTEFEIKHEFDSVIRSERDYFTVANIGEVMPGATSPLGMEVLVKFVTFSLLRNATKNGKVDSSSKCRYFSKADIAMQSFYYHAMLPVPELISRHGHDTLFSKGFMISMFGRPVEEPEVYEVAKERIPDALPPTFWKDLKFLKELFFYDRNLERIKKKVNNYDFPFLKCTTSEETFEALLNTCSEFHEAATNHIVCMEMSSHWNVMIFLLLVRSRGRFDTDVYSDFGRILATSTDLESADIPSSLQRLAKQIVEDLGAEKFKSLSLEEAEKWLNSTNTDSGEQYHQFLTRHGHRCLKEFDVYSIPWGQDPKVLIQLLQTLVGVAKEESIENSDEDYSKMFSELRVPLSLLNKILLRFVIPNSRKGVRSREAGKSLLIKSVDNWRKGYQHLAKLMVAEGRIPDKELLYFMTFDEIRTLLKTRYPKIIARANSRRKLFPILEEYKFPEITRGFPKPVNEDDNSDDAVEYVADLTMQGIPVSQGVTKGYARVATSLEEAALLKPGEILIAYSTDIGWSPYFPVISGVVTELGGLISHGAVVSREYGLPCVVGLKGATKQFKTGDYVLLDGKKGILHRLPHPQE